MIATAPRQKGEMSDSLFSLVVLCFLGLAIAVAMFAQHSKVSGAVCRESGEVQYVSVHDSGIVSHIQKQHEVTCNDGNSYWIQR